MSRGSAPSTRVAGVGLHTLVGMSAAASAAAVRARLSRFADHPYLIDREGEPLRVAAARHLGNVQGVARLLALAAPALLEASAPLAAPSAALRPPALFLGLPERRPGFTRADADALSASLKTGPFSEVFALPEGGSTSAIALAHQAIVSDKLDVCVAGGVDSHLHQETLSWLDQRTQLSSSGSRSGFVPGEAAAFVLLCSASAARKLGLSPSLEISGVGLTDEPNRLKTPTVCLGEGLALAIGQAIQAPPDQVFCDLNGERYRSEEWALASLRLPELLPDPSRYQAPARVLGDVGAASGATFIALIAQALNRNYGRARRFLACTSSEAGKRAALGLRAIAPQGAG